MQERESRCVICDGDMLFEVPPREDGRDECPELICTRCGAAEVLTPIVVHLWKPGRGRVAPVQRSAA